MKDERDLSENGKIEEVTRRDRKGKDRIGETERKREK